MQLVYSFLYKYTKRNKDVFTFLNHNAHYAKILWNKMLWYFNNWMAIDNTWLSGYDLAYMMRHGTFESDYSFVKQMGDSRFDSTCNNFYGALESYKALFKKRKKKEYHHSVKIPHYTKEKRYYFCERRVKYQDGWIKLAKSIYWIKLPNFSLENIKEICQVRFYPVTNRIYRIEIVYKKEEKQFEGTYSMGIDIGINYLSACITNNPDLTPLLYNGRPIKSLNKWFNDQKAIAQHKEKGYGKLSLYRANKIKWYFHNISYQIIQYCLYHNIGSIFIGHNKGWKQEVEMGKERNREFVSIPFQNFIDMIQYKGQLEGIHVEIVEESYTSKTDHLAGEKLIKYGEDKPEFNGKRNSKRNWFTSKTGLVIHDDINGAIGILRKGIGDSCIEAIRTNKKICNPCTITIHESI